jgi:nitroreductase
MFENITSMHSQALDEILNARHTVRAFNPNPPEKEEIEKIIRAGIIAPFASFPSIGKTDFRKFFIISSTSSTLKRVENVIDDRLSKFASKMEADFGPVPFVNAIKRAKSMGIVQLLNNAPYLLIVGEREGIPAIASESLSYCMQIMWLKAISLKIGFRPVTFIMHLKLGDDDEFCELLGISSGEYSLDGCALGYPADNFTPRPVNYPDFDSNVKWLK